MRIATALSILPFVITATLASGALAAPTEELRVPATIPDAVQHVLDAPRNRQASGDGIELDEHWREAALRWAERDGISTAEALERTRQRLARASRQRATTRGTPILTVGGDAACDYQNGSGLQAALDAAASDANGTGLTEVRVAKNGDYDSRRYFINDLIDQTVTLIGGYDDCSDTTINGQTVIDGQGIAGPLVSIDENTGLETVRLEHLSISGASSTTSDGGALAIGNNNFVLLDFVSLLSNSAGRGGAVFIDGSGDDTFLWLVGENTIRFNSAETEGGGIWCNQSESVVLDDMVLLSDNSAENGGGIFTEFGCVVTSYASAPAGILDNSASVDGGGVYVDGPNDTFTLTSGENSFFGFGDATVPALVDGNSSGRSGAGFYASGSAQINALDARITNNTASTDTSDGFSGTGGAFRLANGASLTVDRTLDAVDCHSPVRCSEISDNAAVFGSAIYASGSNVEMDIRQTFITGNGKPPEGTSQSTVVAFSGAIPDNGSSLYMEGNVIADNPPLGTGRLWTFQLRNLDTATFGNNTITDNHTGVSDRTFFLEGQTNVRVYSSIVYESTGTVFDNPFVDGITGVVDCINVREASSLPPATAILDFRAPRLGPDYALTPNSPALDFCDTLSFSPEETDIAGRARGVDQAAIDDRLGAFDLGAWEYVEPIVPSTFSFVTGVLEVLEDDLTLTIDVERIGGSDGEVGIQYFTLPGSASNADDFVPLDDNLVWADGETGAKQFQLVINDDALVEGTETLTVNLSANQELAEIGTIPRLQITIFDDETTLFADGFEG